MLCDASLGAIVEVRLKSGIQMSEPVSTAEIEDVLSSIRRLVSNDVEAAKEEPAPEAADEEPAGKLILTADFRVSESQDGSADTSEDRSEDTSEDASEDTSEDLPENIAANSGRSARQYFTLESSSDEMAVEEDEEAPLEFHHTNHSASTDSEFEAQVDSEIEAETEAEVEAVAEVEVEASDDEDDSNEVWQDADEADAQAETDETNASPLEDKIAELEAAIGQQDGDWEPDGSDFEEDVDAEEMMSEPVQDWIDGTAQEVVEEVADKVEAEPKIADSEAASATADEMGNGDADLFGGDESVIDEETLRDMVSDIVRQELQGALGERITRNVRKLVRREINRVLASQEFD